MNLKNFLKIINNFFFLFIINLIFNYYYNILTFFIIKYKKYKLLKMNLKDENANFNYIFTEKPLIYKNLKLKKITDLIEKNNKDSNQLNKKKEINDEDLDVCSEEYLTKYFAQYNIILDINKDPNLKENNDEQQNINETENDYSMSSKSSYKSPRKESLFPLKKENKRDEFDELLLDDVLSDEDLNDKENRIKKNKINFSKYISSIFLINCQIESIEGIDKTFNNILANSSIHNEIKDKIENKLLLIQWLDLSNNKIKFIHDDLANLVNLKILKLKNNLINEYKHVKTLSKLKNLITLYLEGNKICKIPGYRFYIIKICDVLKNLDGSAITEKELEIVTFGGNYITNENKKNKKYIKK